MTATLQTRARFGALDGYGVTTWHDGFGRPVLTLLNMAGEARYLYRHWDADGRPLSLTYPNDVVFGFGHDGLGRMTSVHEKATPTQMDDYVVRYWYRPEGTRHAAVRGSGSGGFSTVYYYDPVQRPSVIASDLPFPGSSLSIGLQYNPAGQIARLDRDNDSYAWRGAQDLVRDHETDGQNRYLRTSSDGVQTAAFGYDGNGNLASEATAEHSRSYVYDVENRLVAASGTGGNVELLYDPLGRLWRVTGQSGATQFLYDGDKLIAEYDGSGSTTPLRRYVHGPGTDEPVAVYEGGGLGPAARRYMLPDERGSIAALVRDGLPPAINTYDEYGIPGSGNIGRFQYTGQTWIPELGLYYYKARFYSARLGRFLQTDPIGYEDQINLYTYVGNDPVNLADPTGKDAIVIIKENGNINIIIPITFTGDAATPGNIATVAGNIESRLSGSFQGLHVSTKVVQGTSSVDPGITNTMAITNNNTSLIDNNGKQGHSFVRGNYAEITMKDVNLTPIRQPNGTLTPGAKGADTPAHEGGHLIGLPDNTANNVGLMSGNMFDASVSRSDIESIMQTHTSTGVNSVIRCPDERCPR